MKKSTILKAIAGINYLSFVCANVVVDSVRKNAPINPVIKQIGRSTISATIGITGIAITEELLSIANSLDTINKSSEKLDNNSINNINE